MAGKLKTVTVKDRKNKFSKNSIIRIVSDVVVSPEQEDVIEDAELSEPDEEETKGVFDGFVDSDETVEGSNE